MNRIYSPTMRDLSLFALPILVGNILQSCYNMVDMAVVGQFMGREALAAVSNTSMICFISNSICIGFTVGGNVLVANYRGAKDASRQQRAIQTLFGLSLAGGILLTLLNYLLYRPVLRLMNIPPDAFDYAVEYMQIICAGNLFVFGYNAVCSVLRGLGDSRRPLYFVAVTAVVNIALDYLFVGALHWGIRGAALATVLAQAASFGAALWSLKRQGSQNRGFVFHFDRHSLHIHPQFCSALVRIGLPTALRSAALNMSYLVVTALFNGYGTAAAAAAGIGLKVNTFVAMPCWAAGQAVTTMAGHSLGAQDTGRAKRIAQAGIALSLASTGLFLLLLHLLLYPFLGIFTADAEVIALGAQYLRICCSVNFIPYAIMYVLDSFATAAGAPILAMVNSMLHSVVIRLGLSLLLSAVMGLGYTELCFAESVSPIIPCCIGLVFFLRGRWRSGKPDMR